MTVRISKQDTATWAIELAQAPFEHEEHLLRYLLALVNEKPTEVEVLKLSRFVKGDEEDNRAIDKLQSSFSLVELLDKLRRTSLIVSFDGVTPSPIEEVMLGCSLELGPCLATDHPSTARIL
jgi:hypothetical protein